MIAILALKNELAPKYAPPATCKAPVVGEVDAAALANVRIELDPVIDVLPDTSNLLVGADTPMPTLPSFNITSLSLLSPRVL